MSRPLPRFVLADTYYGGTRHALLNRTDGPAMCDEPEPPGRWVLNGFTSGYLIDSVQCAGCRHRAGVVMVTANAVVDVDPNDFGPLPLDHSPRGRPGAPVYGAPAPSR